MEEDLVFKHLKHSGSGDGGDDAGNTTATQGSLAVTLVAGNLTTTTTLAAENSTTASLTSLISAVSSSEPSYIPAKDAFYPQTQFPTRSPEEVRTRSLYDKNIFLIIIFSF